MKERRPKYIPTDRDYRLDGEPRPLYYGDYRETYNKVLKETTIIPWQPLPHFIKVLFIGNNTLKPEDFDLKNPDRKPIGEIHYPGKSATIAFTLNRDVACGAIFDRPARKDKRTDFLFIISAEDLSKIKFTTYYCPEPNNPLHVRIVHDLHKNKPEVWMIPYQARRNLVELLQGNKINDKQNNHK